MQPALFFFEIGLYFNFLSSIFTYLFSSLSLVFICNLFYPYLFSILSSISTHRIPCCHIFTQISQNLLICFILFDLFPAFSVWLPISKCSLSCGGGATTEIRSCAILGFCQGPTLMNVTCNTHPCPGMT